jgi:hypothetical protein
MSIMNLFKVFNFQMLMLFHHLKSSYIKLKMDGF